MHANPTGGTVTHGSATIDQNGNTLTINQGTDRLILGWHSFSIGQGETTRFVQPSSSSMALNRVNGGTRSMIEGRLEANGGVILINPAGITVTKSGVVNVNTFIGSTHNITDDEFLKGGALNFKGTSDASIENLGTIHAETGDIALIARTVRNEGTLSAPRGVVGLAAGDEVLYQPNAEERLLVKSQTASAASIHHSGSIQAAAAEIKAAGNPYAVAINLDGIIEARGNAAKNIKSRVIVHAPQGDIKVGSSASISAADENNGGLVKLQAVTGNLQTGGRVAVGSSAGKGGEIQILGNTITVSGTALLDASGATGGGKIFVGGDYQGGANPTKNYANEPLQNASTLRIDKGALMNADASVQGDGGVVINWADGTTVSSGSVSAKGGAFGGNGGFVEISGKQNLGFDGSVDVGAPKGIAGIVLFDPAQIQITSATELGLYSDPAIHYGVTNLISYTDYSSTDVWVMSQSFFTNFTSGTIILQAYNISLEDPKGNKRANIVLNPDVNLELHSKAGGTDPKVFLPSMTETSGSSSWGDTTRSSITASGTGYVKLDASQGSQLVIHGDITTAAGDIILIAQNGINLAGAMLKSTNGGAVNITSSAGNIVLNGSQISGTSGAIEITATNGSIAATYSTISNSTGPISMVGQTGFNLTGSSIQSTDGDIAISSPAGAITMYSYAHGGMEANRIGSAIRSGSGSISLLSQNEIYLGGSTITTSGTNGGSVSLTSTGSFIKLYSDSIGTSTVIQSAIQTVGGNIVLKGAQDGNITYGATAALYNFAVTIDGALLSSLAGNMEITSLTGSIFLNYGSLLSATTLQTGSGNIDLKGQNNIYINYDPYFGYAAVSSPATIQTGSGDINVTAPNSIILYNTTLKSTNGGSISLTSSGGYSSFLQIYNSLIQTAGKGSVNLTASSTNTTNGYSYVWLGNSIITTALGNVAISSQNSSTNGYGSVYVYNSSIQSMDGGSLSLTSSGGSESYVYLASSTLTSSSGNIALFAQGSAAIYFVLLNSSIQSTTAAIDLIKQGGTNYASLSEILNNWYQTLFISGSSITSGSGAITLSSENHILIDPVASTNGTYWPTSAIASVISSATGTVSMTAVATNGIYRGSNAIANATPAPSPSATPTPTPIVVATPTPTPSPASQITQSTIVAEPTVQIAVQSLTIRNNTTTTSSGGSFGSSGPGSEGSASGGESASAGETTSSGESSASESGGETASSESSGESGASSESSTASADSGSGATTASSDSSSSSGSASTASSSSVSSSGGSASSSSGASSQGARAQAAAMSRMNNPVGGATVGGAEFQRLNPFSDAGAMHEEASSTPGSTGAGNTQASTGRAAAVSVKSPEMTELAPMNDLNVLFMMF